jgi:NhaA family Na+:H+ antiporter
MYRVSPVVRHFAQVLLGGIGIATLWVNLSPDSYYDAIEWRLADLPFPADWTALPDSLTPMSLVSGGLMAVVLALLAKELWEALVLERGALRAGNAPGDRSGTGPTPRPALLPLAAVLGGSLAAVIIWLALSAVLPKPVEAGPGAGWPVPIGSDVVLAYAAGRLVFRLDHPALHLLLLITIAFDILGLLVAGLAFPTEGLKPAWLLLSALSVCVVWALAARHARPTAPERLKRRAGRLWPYLLAGGGSWAGIALSGLPGALGLLPLIPVIPHAERTFGLFAEAEAHLHDPLNRLARAAVWPVTATLFLFGLTRGGLDFGALTTVTLTTVAAFWIGKPLGLLAGLFAVLATGRAVLPRGVSRADLVRLAVLASLGFTVPALSIDASLPGGAMAEAARLGLALSLVPAGVLVGLSRLGRSA